MKKNAELVQTESKQTGQVVPAVMPILIVNFRHRLVKKLVSVRDEASFDEMAELISDQVLTAEDGMPSDPSA
jgi:molecular chaperone HtpG